MGGLEDFLDPFLIEELGSVIGGYFLKSVEGAFARHRSERVEDGLESTPLLALDASLGKPVFTGESVHGQDVSAMFDILLPQVFQRLVSFHQSNVPGEAGKGQYKARQRPF